MASIESFIYEPDGPTRGAADRYVRGVIEAVVAIVSAKADP
jgi:hypothetical protein